MSLSAVASMSSALRNYWRPTQDEKPLAFDSDDSVISETIPSVVEVTLDSSECSLESGSVSDTSFDAGSEVISTSDSDFDVSIFNTNAKWIDSISKLKISLLQSHDRNIVGNTNIQNSNEHSVQATKNMEWNDYCAKLDITMFQACDMNMVAGSTTHAQQIHLPSTINANTEWTDHCSKLEISTLQACDMDMVSYSECVKEIDDTESKNMERTHPNTEWINHCSKLDISTLQASDMDMVQNNRCMNENGDSDSNDMTYTPATTSFPKINLKILLCLFLLAVMTSTRFLTTYKSFSFTKNNTEACFNTEIETEVRRTKQEVEHVVKARKGLILRNIIPTMPGDGVVHF